MNLKSDQLELGGSVYVHVGNVLTKYQKKNNGCKERAFNAIRMNFVFKNGYF